MQGVAARALEFAILTAARSGEVLGARWDEIDLQRKVWTVPAERMKGGREHRVPLSDRAMAILNELHRGSHVGLRVSGLQARVARSATWPWKLCCAARKSMSRRTASARRSGTGPAIRTAFARDVVEAALAHAIENKTEAAYRRSDALEKRRKLMAAWAAYCESAQKKKSEASVTPLRRVM